MLKNELLKHSRNSDLDGKDRAHKLFLHGIMRYVNGKIDVFELCDRLIRVDSIINGIPLDEARTKRKAALNEKIIGHLVEENLD